MKKEHCDVFDIGFILVKRKFVGVETGLLARVGEAILMELCFLLTGLAKSGKSTIERIVFQEQGHLKNSDILAPGRQLKTKIVSLPETSVILEPTSPAPYDDSLFDGCCSVLYIVDITNDYVNSLAKLCALAVRTQKSGRILPIEVFLHKADAFEDNERQEILKDITQKVKEELEEICPTLPAINFYLTSVFDQTIYVCLSRIVQKHLPESPAFEALLDMLCMNSKIEKAYLFDSARKLYLAADSSPFGIRSFELASVVLDMITDLGSIYRPHRLKREKGVEKETLPILDQSVSAHGELKISNGIIVGFSKINSLLSLLYIINSQSHPGKIEQVQHNVAIAKDAIIKVIETNLPPLIGQ